MAEYDLARILSQDVTTQLSGKVTSARNKEITNRQFVVVDAMLYQHCETSSSIALLSLAPSPGSSIWELWLHVVELPVAEHVANAGNSVVEVTLRRRVAFLRKPASPQLHPELFRKERSNSSDSLFISWFNGSNTRDSKVSSDSHFSFHALEVADIEQYCTDASTGEPSAHDDSGAYLEYLHLHDTDTDTDSRAGAGGSGNAKSSCLAEGVVTGVPLAAADITHRPFLTINVVASLNNTAYSSGRNRATQAVPANALPIYELTLVWRDGALFSCLPPKASVRDLYTTSKAGATESQQLAPEAVIMNYVTSEGRITENQCFTALVKATYGTSKASAHGKLLNSAGASAILAGALVVSRSILNQRELTGTHSGGASAGAGATASDLLSHRLLMEKKSKHDKLFPLMRSVLENSHATGLDLCELSWHHSLLLGSLVLANHMRDVRLYGDATPSMATRGGLTSTGSRFSQTRDKKRDRMSEGGEMGHDEFLGAVQRGMEVVLPAAGQTDMPGHSAEDVFFAHPFLLPLGLYRIAKELEQRREVTRGNSNHTLLAATCNFLSLLLSVIQAPKVTDFSYPGAASADESGRKRGTPARQNKKADEEVKLSNIEEDASCLALASEENVRIELSCCTCMHTCVVIDSLCVCLDSRCVVHLSAGA
jgi:hypothetical protein